MKSKDLESYDDSEQIESSEIMTLKIITDLTPF